MTLKYVKIDEDWDDLKDGSFIIFDLPTSKIYYTICNSPRSKYWWLVNDDFNGQIFNELEINGKSLIESIVGYPCSGVFPEVESLDDLKKVIKALDDECIKKFGMPNNESEDKSEPKPKFKIGDKVRILPRQGSSEDYRSSYVDEMLDCVGKTAIIVSCDLANITTIKWPDDGYVYILEGYSWSWNSSMLELVENSDSKEEEYIHPSKLKDGDFIKIRYGNTKDFIYIFKEYENDCVYRHVSLDLNDSMLNTNSSCWGKFTSNDKITYATEEEKKLLNEALLKGGYIWDNSTKELKSIQSATLMNLDAITVGPVTNIGLIDYPITSKTKYYISLDSVEEEINKEELNLFPTKKHYQLNFNY